ncbi:M23 family metallopeptidase [Lentibacillus cibarius]|uniref:M23 family metallopeptidase n=1 Tax=Lentibacillus cibarius TaxID=2583219 RepID=A0A5S3QGY9_9BACI|nr:M23 family metallopeptidase [Lentibacillus cibarius]TMN21077.1 M23 family metallopeptidase [Lentibacillus cibarius]
MSKGVKKVRKSINRRKKLRGLTSNERPASQMLPSSLPQEEEKHGYYPVFTDSSPSTPLPSRDRNRYLPGFVLKGMLSAVLFFGAGLLFQTDSSLLSKPKQWTEYALTEELPFARVNQWYQETFGAPMGLQPAESQTSADGQALAFPVSGSVSETFQTNGTGIKISPDEKTNVSALQGGVVIFAGNDKDLGKKIVVQHADDSETVYGQLSSINVHLYQFIEDGQTLGTFKPGPDSKNVYFAIEKDDAYIDPVQVIKVDDAS